MIWFKKKKRGIQTEIQRDVPDGLWIKCDECGEIIFKKQLDQYFWTCPKCGYHFKVTSDYYIKILLDEGTFQPKDEEILPTDPLNFKDRKKYTDRLKAAQEKTGLTEAIRVGLGKIDNIPVSFGVMDFRFIGGSMGSVVGERVARAIERSMDQKIPLVIVCASGGARMQEGILSLMQMAKTSALLAKHDDMGLPYITVLTNPTTAGVMASYASLGDVIIAEPKALLGFAGPRVIQQTIGQELPPGFQSSEFFQEHGFVDMVVPRPHLRSTLITLLRYLYRPADQIPPLGEE
ncbi:acetyl-CoA carboxylase carboxyltransferase subunit beta [bacterium]|nr:acetyl-CoA carboxylase carboxyltransferase subunit beta [bacterium]